MRVQTKFTDETGEKREANKDVRSVLVRSVIEMEAGETRNVGIPLTDGDRRLLWLESSLSPSGQTTEALLINNNSESFRVSLVPSVGVAFPIVGEGEIQITNNSSQDGFVTMVVLDD